MSIGRGYQDVSIVKTFRNPNDKASVTFNFVVYGVYRTDQDMIAKTLHEAKKSLVTNMKTKVSLLPSKMFSFFCLEEDDFDSAGDNKNFSGMILNRGKDDKGGDWKYY